MSEVSSATGHETEHRKGVGAPAETAEAKPSGLPGRAFARANPNRKRDTMTEQHIAFMLSKIPMGRLLEVGEAAAMIAWLASEDCSFSTGAVFDLSGGRATY